MKKILKIIFITVVSVLNAQNSAHRFFYELSYKPNKDSMRYEKEMMILDIDKKQSVYQSYELIVLDSLSNDFILKNKNNGAIPDFNTMPEKSPLSFSHRIFKNYPIQDIQYTDVIYNDNYSYLETPDLIWKISNEKQKTGNYVTQKAETNYGGRRWTAWFTTDLPFQDGPYKFYGLPGLIIKIEDSEKNYSWELQGNKKIDTIKNVLLLEKMDKKNSTAQARQLSKEKFEEKFKEYKKDPFAQIRQMASQLPAGMKLPDGSSISDGMRDAEKKAKEMVQRNNNSIELTEKKK
ncbi:GLPGLI family protein [Chryseobacterium sp. Tr-659]|uniref:GLPGLI family protein n=1 Tax=Chryseobacterium sp. Tr-659 TaxID=2608340 RepID=UPI00141F04CF|nr:GLPGLI family protein [Chryseobacterium sp. Tr-659]NIF05668.1 GLPGLI family protein [Chryseobacterium sp. Tr-659]